MILRILYTDFFKLKNLNTFKYQVKGVLEISNELKIGLLIFKLMKWKRTFIFCETKKTLILLN